MVEKGFVASLFDLSFTSFVTTKLIRVLYVLSLVMLGLGYVVGAAMVFGSAGGAAGVLWLFLFGPLMVFFYTLAYRVLFELVIVLFRIFENTRDQLALQRAALGNNGGDAGTAQAMAPGDLQR